MDLSHQIGIAQVQFVVAAIDVNALGVEHRTHRAIEDVNPVGVKQVSERFHSALRNCGMRSTECESGRRLFQHPIGVGTLSALYASRLLFLEIRNPKYAIQNQKSRAKQRGTS
jgi:hypothetical protein